MGILLVQMQFVAPNYFENGELSLEAGQWLVKLLFMCQHYLKVLGQRHTKETKMKKSLNQLSFLSHVLTNKENLSQKSHLLNKSVNQKECALSQNVTYSVMHCNNLVSMQVQLICSVCRVGSRGDFLVGYLLLFQYSTGQAVS